MKKNRFNALNLFLLLTLFLLAACGNEDTAATEKGGSSEKTGDEKVLRVGTSGIYPPFVSKGKDGNLEGYDVEVLETVGEKLGYKVEWTVAEFAGLFGMMDNGKIDTIANLIAITETRSAKYDFTDPYAYSGVTLVVKDDRNDIQSLEDMKGKNAGVLLGNNMHEFVQKWNEENGNEINIKPYQDVSGTYSEVALGRLDAFVDSKITAVSRIDKEGLPLKLASDEPVFSTDHAFPFVKTEENKAFIEEFNKALQELKDSGKLKEISDKWSEIDFTTP